MKSNLLLKECCAIHRSLNSKIVIHSWVSSLSHFTWQHRMNNTTQPNFGQCMYNNNNNYYRTIYHESCHFQHNWDIPETNDITSMWVSWVKIVWIIVWLQMKHITVQKTGTTERGLSQTTSGSRLPSALLSRLPWTVLSWPPWALLSWQPSALGTKCLSRLCTATSSSVSATTSRRGGSGWHIRLRRSSGRLVQLANCRHSTSACSRIGPSDITLARLLMCWSKGEEVRLGLR